MALLIIPERGIDLRGKTYGWGILQPAGHIAEVRWENDRPSIFYAGGICPGGEMSWTLKVF